MKLVVQVKRLPGGEKLALPAYAHEGDAGLDLVAAVGRKLYQGERYTFPTGIAVAIPDGYFGLIRPRSGRASKEGLLLASSGVVDEGYRGEMSVPLINLGEKPVMVERGQRIAQLIVLERPLVAIVEVDELPPSSRGTGGFGSTGT